MENGESEGPKDDEKPKIKVVEKRASRGRDKTADPVEEVMKADEESRDLPKDSKRVAPGVRRLSEYFGPKQLERVLTRGDYLNLRMMEEYDRREGTPLRRLWRWLNKIPQVMNIPAIMARDHAKALNAIKKDLTARHDVEDEAQRRADAAAAARKK